MQTIPREILRLCINVSENFIIVIIFSDLSCLGSNINYDYFYIQLQFKNNLGRYFFPLTPMIYFKVPHTIITRKHFKGSILYQWWVISLVYTLWYISPTKSMIACKWNAIHASWHLSSNAKESEKKFLDRKKHFIIISI